ncbi:MAG: hypothetical protein ACYC4L_08735 [Chloroflexota bacterium]
MRLPVLLRREERRRLHRGDFVGGLLAGLLTGAGVGLLLAPRRGQGLDALQQSELGHRAAGLAPMLLEAGLVVLTQTRPLLGRAAWGLVQLAGRTRPRRASA